MARPNVGDRFPVGAVGTAKKEHVLEGETFSSEAEGVNAEGSMTNRGAVDITLTNQNEEYTVLKGFHNGLGKIKAAITNLIAGNIKNGVSVGGITGTFPNDGTAGTGDVLSGKTFYNDSATKRTGTMIDRGAVTITPGMTDQPIPAGYHNGSGKVKAKYSIRPSNTLQISSDTSKSITQSTPVKLKEIKIGKSGGCKVSFRLTADSESAVCAQIYINDSPSVGVDCKCIEETITFSQYIAVRPGDKIQIYGYREFSSYTGRIANFRIYYDVEDNTTYTDDEVLLS